MIILWRWVGWLLVVAAVAFTLSPIELRPTSTAPANLERFICYAAATAAVCLGYPRRAWQIILLMVALASALEVLQQLVPGRHGHMRDLVFKIAGTLIGAVTAFMATQVPKLVAARRRNP